jgi:hypothetical protein
LFAHQNWPIEKKQKIKELIDKTKFLHRFTAGWPERFGKKKSIVRLDG